MPERDPCVSCFCQSGSLMCKKKVCPVLYCPASKIKHKKGDCCPQCQGILSITSEKTGFFLNSFEKEKKTLKRYLETNPRELTSLKLLVRTFCQSHKFTVKS